MKETTQKITCANCGRVIDISSATLVNHNFEDEKYLCDTCLADCIFCSHCGHHYTSQHEWASDNIFSVCNHCASNYEICSSCSEVHHRNNIHYHNDEPYCENCYNDMMEEEINSYIEEYGYKPSPTFLGESDDNLFLGVQLEVHHGKTYQASKRISDNTDDVYLKHDGSLETGFEIVSHPATLQYHKSKLGWEHIMNICTEAYMRSHDTSTCGLHCHVSRLFFGATDNEQDLHIAKLILLINKFWEQYIVPFSRRHIATLERWAAKPSINILDTDTEEDIIDKVKDTKYRGRYQGINLENYATIEFRIFRGTLNINTFIATLQFVDCICRFAKAMKLSDIYTVSWGDLFAGKDSEYPELMCYLKSKNLI